MPRLRPPAVAGAFYPADPAELQAEVRRLLAGVPEPSAVADLPPKAVIVPHAGYRYSGPVAASVYGRLGALRRVVRTVAMLGPAHYWPAEGLFLSGADSFASPAGTLRVDTEAVARVTALDGASVCDAAHEPEHCLEVQLPFILETLGDVAIVPMLAGGRSGAAAGAALETLWNGPETLVLVSSDLSHDLPYSKGRARDLVTARAIEALDPAAIPEGGACGVAGVAALLRVARARGLRARVLDLRSSGDTAPGAGRVVGYGAFTFS